MKIKKIAALLCVLVMSVSALAYTAPLWQNTASADDVYMMSDGLVITKAEGYLESAYVEWTNTSHSDSYNVYVKGGKFGDYTKIDDELIRYYGSYYRADALGLTEGTYTMKVAAVNGGVETAVETDTLTVTAHTREGFAFSQNSPNKTASGGYNDDGSVKDNAHIIYVTSENVQTVKATIYEGSKTHECTGLGEILKYLAKGGDSRPTIIRIIGTINGPATDRYTGAVLNAQDDFGDVLNSNGYIEVKTCTNLTLEGVGNDATFKGAGILVKGANNVEVRNLGVMLFADDGISLDTANNNVWVHNNDVFYGMPGSDSDQVKGDGSIDCKKSHYITISSNHIWDGGKASLLDAGATTNTENQSNYITYHHNWFDHSDSRHPRIRHATTHIYNNYFDGNSKYGTGVTSGASAFVEANVYRNCKNPFFSSEQGNEGGNSLSGEAGGIIKAYNNAITGGEEPIYASADNKQDFDAYLATTRDEKVSSEYTTLQSTFKGVSYPNTYNNFDTDESVMYDYTPENTSTVVATVEKYAGRGENSDFTYDFNDDEADKSHDIDEVLKTQLAAYSTSLIYDYCDGGVSYPATDASVTPAPKPTSAPTPTPDPNATPTPTPTAKPTLAPSKPLPDGTLMWYAGETVEEGGAIADIPGLSAVGKLESKDSEGMEINGINFSGVVRGKKDASEDGKSGTSLKFIPSVNGEFTAYVKSDKGYTFYVKDADGNVITSYTNNSTSDTQIALSFNAEVGKTYYIFEYDKRAYFYGASFYAPLTDVTPQPTTVPTETPKPTDVPTETVKPTTEPTSTPDVDSTPNPVTEIEPIGDYVGKVNVEKIEDYRGITYLEVRGTNSSVKTYDMKLYTAVYDENNNLVSVIITVSSRSSYASFAVPEISGKHRVKHMLWDNEKKPVIEAIEK